MQAHTSAPLCAALPINLFVWRSSEAEKQQYYLDIVSLHNDWTF